MFNNSESFSILGKTAPPVFLPVMQLLMSLELYSHLLLVRKQLQKSFACQAMRGLETSSANPEELDIMSSIQQNNCTCIKISASTMGLPTPFPPLTHTRGLWGNPEQIWGRHAGEMGGAFRCLSRNPCTYGTICLALC